MLTHVEDAANIFFYDYKPEGVSGLYFAIYSKGTKNLRRVLPSPVSDEELNDYLQKVLNGVPISPS